MPHEQVKMKAVYTIVEKEGIKTRWVRIGIGFVNQDGSINLRLDAVPVNGRLHVRNFKKKDERSDSAGVSFEKGARSQDQLFGHSSFGSSGRSEPAAPGVYEGGHAGLEAQGGEERY